MAKRVLGPPPMGHVVAKYDYNGSTVLICDDAYRDRTAEEIAETWRRIMEIGWEIVLAARERGVDI